MTNKSFTRKSILARLLANENITVQQGNFDTASFNPHTRVLSLPYWQGVTADVYDLLVGHEVAHALFTPADKEAERSKKYPFSYLNIIEDVRIEKLILRKYPGLVGNFKRGYKEMVERDFFHLQDRKTEKLQFMDRLNIHAKTRGLIDVPFSDEELVWVHKAEQTETFDEAVALTEEIALWLKYQEHKKQQEQQQWPKPGQSEETEDGDGETHQVEVDMSEAEETDGDGEGQQQEAGDDDEAETPGSASNTNEASDETEAEDETGSGEETKDEAEDEKSGKSEAGDSEETGDAEGEDDIDSDFDPDDYDLDEAITDGALDNVQEQYSPGNTTFVKGFTKEQVKLSTIDFKTIIHDREKAQARHHLKAPFPQDAYAKFMKEIKTVVGPMVKEFEMRKAATQSARTRTANKGSLDVNKLHKYRYDDRLFKSVSWVGDAKNHGMIVLVDHSGSMQQQMAMVRRQLLILATFCKRVNIPFDIYGFTTLSDMGAPGNDILRKKQMPGRHSDFLVDDLGLTELLNSRMRKSDYDKAFRQIFWLMEDRGAAVKSSWDKLGMTPLNAAIASMRTKILEFRKLHGVEKMNLVVLTDGGDSGEIETFVKGKSNGGGPVRDMVIDIEGELLEWNWFNDCRNTEKSVRMIRDMGVNVVNYHIVRSEKSIRKEVKKLTSHTPFSKYPVDRGEYFDKEVTNRAMRELRQNGVVSFDESMGYHRRLFMHSESAGFNGVVGQITENLVGATASKVAKALSNQGAAKRAGRILATKFCEMVS
jgi:hypothetical protein